MESTSNPPNNCIYTICTSNNAICRIRFDFDTFILDTPATGTIVARQSPTTPADQADKGICDKQCWVGFIQYQAPSQRI